MQWVQGNSRHCAGCFDAYQTQTRSGISICLDHSVQHHCADNVSRAVNELVCYVNAEYSHANTHWSLLSCRSMLASLLLLCLV